MELPPQVQALVNAISALPGVAGCFCGPKPLSAVEPSHLSLPGEFGDLPQVAIVRTQGGRPNEVMIQVEIILDRSAGAWLSLEFLAWWVRDCARSGHEIQMRPMALPPKLHKVQLGQTLKFFIEYFVIEQDDSYTKTLEITGGLAESIVRSMTEYRECFANPAPFTGDVESI